jgi:hypothetical protein
LAFIARTFFHVLAQLDDVAALLHRHAQADHFLAVEAHLVARRVLYSRLMVAKSPRRKVVPLARSSRFSRSLTVFERPSRAPAGYRSA